MMIIAIFGVQGYCQKFKRLLSTEVIDMGDAKGCVLLWGGLGPGDAPDTRAEIMRFVEDDPFVNKDIVDTWDVMDITPPRLRPKLAAAAAVAAKGGSSDVVLAAVVSTSEAGSTAK
jgi:hypothetical protein